MAKYTDISSLPYLLTEDGKKIRITELIGKPENEIWVEYSDLWRKIIQFSFGICPSEKDNNGNI